MFPLNSLSFDMNYDGITDFVENKQMTRIIIITVQLRQSNELSIYRNFFFGNYFPKNNINCTYVINYDLYAN